MQDSNLESDTPMLGTPHRSAVPPIPTAPSPPEPEALNGVGDGFDLPSLEESPYIIPPEMRLAEMAAELNRLSTRFYAVVSNADKAAKLLESLSAMPAEQFLAEIKQLSQANTVPCRLQLGPIELELADVFDANTIMALVQRLDVYAVQSIRSKLPRAADLIQEMTRRCDQFLIPEEPQT